MLKIRLTRLGKKNKAFFRLVVAEHTSPIKGRFIEALGFANPHTKERNLNKERILHWIEKGAKCSDTAHNLLVKEGIIKGSKIAVKMKKKEGEEPKEEKKEEAPKKEGEDTPKKDSAPEKKEEKEEKAEERAEPEKKEEVEKKTEG